MSRAVVIPEARPVAAESFSIGSSQGERAGGRMNETFSGPSSVPAAWTPASSPIQAAWKWGRVGGGGSARKTSIASASKPSPA